MNKMVELSIIIPAYNAGKYISSTLNSLKMQTYKDFEVIVVDDGSIDDTVEKCNEFNMEAKREVQVYKNIKGGVSSARNYGISKAKGKYIAFLDADDLVHPECYRILMENIESNDVDVVACAFDTFLDGNEPNQNYDTSSYTTLFIQGGNSAIESMISADKSASVRGFVWNKIYKRKLLEKVKFDENLIICEDSVFSWEIMKTAKTLQLVQMPLYHYRKRINSSTGSANFEKNFTAVEAYSRMIEDIVENRVCLENPYKKELFAQYIYWILHTAESNGANTHELLRLNKYVELIPDTFETKELAFEMRRKLNALKKSPDNFIRAMKMWNYYKNFKKSIKTIIKH